MKHKYISAARLLATLIIGFAAGPTVRGDDFQNLVTSYDDIRTVAGTGQGPVDGVNYWQNSFEGGPAVNAWLSRPHMAMADNANNIYIVDKDSHSVLKVTPDGTIHTVAGTHVAGYNGDGPDVATNLQLKLPNGLWVHPDGVFFVLDTGNGKVRRVDTNGIMSTVITDPSGVINGVTNGFATGRGLYVRDNDSAIYYCDNPYVKRWTPSKGIKLLNNNTFTDLGNIIAIPGTNTIMVTDRGASKVYQLYSNGSRVHFAGSGLTVPPIDGTPALLAGLNQVRGAWPLNGGWLFATHAGCQVWYMDAAGLIHLFVDGAPGAHAGDGGFFHAPGPKIAEARSVTVAPNGNIIIVENDGGFVRVINFTNKPPVITQQPADQTAFVNSTVTLSAAFGGTTPISLKWSKDGMEIGGATNGSLVLANVPLTAAGNYSLYLSNAFGTATSRLAHVTVNIAAVPPSISVQPQSRVAALGSNVVFNFVGAGTGPLQYQWQFNKKPLAGAVNPSLELINLVYKEAGLYRVLITNAYGTAISSNATLKIIAPVSIAVQPRGRTMLAGKPFRFSVAARGTPPLSYQWFFNNTNAIPGATRPVLTLTNVQPSASGLYAVRVSNAASARLSTNATLTVTNAH